MEKKRSNFLTLISGGIILYSLYIILGNGISPGGSNLAAWVAFISFVSAIGIYNFKKWAWYSGIFSLIVDILLYSVGMRGILHEYSIPAMFSVVLPLVYIIYLINSKVKEQFK